MAFDEKRFNKVFKFLQDNPSLISKSERTGKIYPGWIKFDPETKGPVKHLTLSSLMKDENLSYPDKFKLYQETLTFDPIYSLSFPADLQTATTALNERDKIRKFFGKVLVPGSYAYNTTDIDLYRKMLVDWSSAFKTFKNEMLHVSNAFSLDDKDIDKAIAGFGIDFVNENTLPSLINRQLFLLSLADLYKVKGSPHSIIHSLYFAGVAHGVMREYWVERVPNSYKQLQIRGIAALKNRQRFNPNTNSYEWIQNQDYYEDTILTWENFESRLWDIAEPHWWYTNEEIINIEWSPETFLKLPSITPYFGVEFNTDVQKWNTLVSVLHRMMSEQFNAILSGHEDLVPREIGVSGYNEDLDERDLWIEGYDEPVSLVEAYLGWVYAQIRYDEYLQYTDFFNFLKERNVPLEDSVYTYPWAYQELIYHMWKRAQAGEIIEGIFPLDDILKMYPKKTTPYYCSTNELINWWVDRPLDPGETEPHTPYNIPSIFFDSAYSFQFNIEPQDTKMDRIMYYRGDRNTDFKKSPFEWNEILYDTRHLTDSFTARRDFDQIPKSHHSSNRSNPYLQTTYDAQYEHLTTYFNYISWISENYKENEIHDGSKLTPYYVDKYPEPIKWNWAVDSSYFYWCYRPARWCRTNIEIDWNDPNASLLPDSNPPDVKHLNITDPIGYIIYDGNYAYSYASEGKWIRFNIEREWDYCAAPMRPDGNLRLQTDLANTKIKAKVSSEIAANYIQNPSLLANQHFDVTINPLGKNPEVVSHTLTRFEDYLTKYNLVINSEGYILEDIHRYYDGKYIYLRLKDINNQNQRWVRTEVESHWEHGSNGNHYYNGSYKFPNLDLTNRYNAERILRGRFVLSITDLENLPGDTNNGEILVAEGSEGYPEIWIYNEYLHIWEKNPINTVDRINLGFNNGLISWIDAMAQSEEDYETYAGRLLTSFSNYTKLVFDDPELDVAGLYKDIRNGGLHRDLINFFKPKRARLLYFSLNLDFGERLFNSIILDDELETTKTLQQINDYVPRQDLIYIQNNDGLYKKSYHLSDRLNRYIIPENEYFGRAIFYAKGFEDDRVNGFYYKRDDLKTNRFPVYCNESNVILTKVLNVSPIHGYEEQWIIALRQENLDWCCALYVNYSDEYTDNTWILPEEDPSIIITSNRICILSDNLIDSDFSEQDIIKEVDLSQYIQDKENQWNIINNSENERRPDVHPNYKTTRKETTSLRHFGPAFCKDPLNLRKVFANHAQGHPENLEGARVDGFDSDNRNDGVQEEAHSFWRYYPYTDRMLSIKDGAEPILFRTTIQGNTYISDTWFNSYTEEKIQFGTGNNVKTDFYLPILRNNPYFINIWIEDDQLIKDVNWHIVQVNGEWVVRFNVAPTNNSKLYYSHSVPIWWIFESNDFYSGPVHHRPTYIGINNTIYDCYPCRPFGECCDYYDVGCYHDGPTNPKKVQYDEEWKEGQYTEFSLKELDYDVHTQYHRKLGFITDPQKIEHYESEPNWARDQLNFGDTYCTECDDPLFTPDLAFFELPSRYKHNGIYHRQIVGKGFTFANSIFNGIWKVEKNEESVYLFDSSTSNYEEYNEYKKYDFLYCYVHQEHGHVVVPCYHNPSGYYYWEIREKVVGGVTPIRRSKLKRKLHTFDSAWNEDIGHWHVKPDNFLNGHDRDVAEDGWATMNPIPSVQNPFAEQNSWLKTYYIDIPFQLMPGSHPTQQKIVNGKDIEDIVQNPIEGRFEVSAWVRFALSAAPDEYKHNYGNAGQILYHTPDVGTESSLYICVKSNHPENDYLWKQSTNNFEHDWDITDEEFIRPTSPNNFYGYYYKNGYLYLFAPLTAPIIIDDIKRTSLWVRTQVSESEPSNPQSGVTNYWKFLSGYAYAYRYVSYAEPIPNSDAPDFQGGWKEELHVCGDIVPFLETYEGIRLLKNLRRCLCNVRDLTNIKVYAYYEDPTGGYMKIETTTPDGTEFEKLIRREHRWILHNNDPEDTLERLNKYINNNFDPNNNIDEIDHYLYKNYLPLSLGKPNIIQWERSNELTYSKSEIAEEYWDDPFAGIPKIKVTPISHNFGQLEIFEDGYQDFLVENIGGEDSILSGFANGVSEPFEMVTEDLSYNLTPGETKIITVKVYSQESGIWSDNIIFTGGGGQNVPISVEFIELTIDNKIFESDDNMISENGIDNRVIEMGPPL